MKILYDNLLESADALAMTNLDVDSYVEDLFHPYLELACLCTGLTSSVSGTWADPKAIDSVAVAYHNCDTATVTLKDSLGATLYTDEIALQPYDSVYYFAAVEGVYEFEVALSAGSALRVGLVSLGASLEMPPFSVRGSFPLALRSSSSKSPGGQASGVFARQLRGYEISWPRMGNSDRALLLDYLAAVQTCKPHMVDLFPDSHGDEPPFYGTVTDSVEVKKRAEASFYYEVSIKWEESR
jgi:hypothetical protein